MSPSRSTTRSTCQAPPAPTTRQAPNAPESRNAAPPVARASARAAALGSSGTARSRSVVARPSRRSRTAPPTIQAVAPGEDLAGGVERRHAGAPPRWCARGTRALIPQVIS